MTIDTSSHSYLLGVAECERDKFRSALERIALLAPYSESAAVARLGDIAREVLAIQGADRHGGRCHVKLHAKLEINASAAQTSAE
jgi:hypothetical protein